ncbi:MAG TPA: hypothetical protein DCL21_05650, partial [Alphaproteobacteria bacterium]|nr:hypothetical protein [Alphaproteobacteria bacterium]
VIEWVKTRKKTKARALPNKTIKLQKPSKKSTLFENTSESEKNIILMLNRGKGYGIAKSA